MLASMEVVGKNDFVQFPSVQGILYGSTHLYQYWLFLECSSLAMLHTPSSESITGSKEVKRNNANT